MKTIYLNILLILIFIPKSVFSQEKIELKDLGFSINSPKDWFAFNKNQVIPNIKNYDFNKDEIDAFSKQVNESVELITLSKYDPTKHYGITPTIKIRVQKNTTKNIVELQKVLELSMKEYESTLPNLHFIEKSNIVTINGYQIIRSVIGFTLKNNDVEYHIKSYMVLIPVGKFYISLNFTDETKEDNSVLYEELINSIQINPVKKD